MGAHTPTFQNPWEAYMNETPSTFSMGSLVLDLSCLYYSGLVRCEAGDIKRKTSLARERVMDREVGEQGQVPACFLPG